MQHSITNKMKKYLLILTISTSLIVGLVPKSFAISHDGLNTSYTKIDKDSIGDIKSSSFDDYDENSPYYIRTRIRRPQCNPNTISHDSTTVGFAQTSSMLLAVSPTPTPLPCLPFKIRKA